ncbi:monooxygenase [Ramlibacter henchirensis]|uniref:Monooxygenase n=1 Tax=Ramlibacter henchirensis TaxID=204072 RepID=A0A4Z0BQ75_9BURK|nr:FAD-dependent oxidoreductase [Ramlibacter henchirensis]TFZ00594.1 monooxygenase [Ramlibacter henchirensis]
MQAFDADVFVAGAGPVGLTLAMDLASRGAKVTLAEIRRYAEPPSVKCNHVSARTMERFRRLGVAGKLRDAGLPADYPNDVVFRTSMCGIELTRIPIPSRADRYSSREGPDTWWPTPEPPHRINQISMEPILLEHTAALPGVKLLNRHEVLRFTQDDAGVQTTVRDLDTQQERTILARYLVGCDGGSSTVRKQIGARLEGTPVVQRVQSTFIRAPRLREMLQGKPAWCYYSINPRRCGTVFAIDGHSKWLVHNHLNPNEPEFDSIDRDTSIRNILGVGPDFEYEVISKEDWVGRRLVADRFRDRRVFLAGDAAHLWVPYAGYGMNAGIADALNLSWLLGARLQGWGDEAILEAYEAERQPITEQVSHFAMDHAAKMIRARSAVPPNIEAPDAEGQEARDGIAREAYELNVQQFCCAGLNFGYYYDRSPIIASDGESPPGYSMGDFTESTVPGCRAPHFWLEDGRSLYDALGQGYTLLRFDPRADVSAFQSAAARRGMPLTLLDISQRHVPAPYRHKLVLVRDDQHVAWRGDAVPADPEALVGMLCGEPAGEAPGAAGQSLMAVQA